MHLPISVQLPDTSALDAFHREWPVIKQAPFSFALVLGLLALIIWWVIWFMFKNRLEKYRESIEHLKVDIEHLRLETDSLRTAAPSLPTTPTVSFNDLGKSNASIGDIHFHAAAPSSAPILPPVATNLPAPQREKKPHIENRDPEVRSVYIDEDAVWRIGKNPRSRGDVDAMALLLPFYFNAKQSDPGARVEYAKVHLVFTNPKFPKKPITVAHGCWINGRLDAIDVEPGETKHVVLAFFKEDDSQSLLTISTNRIKYDWYDEAGGNDFESEELPRTTYQLEVVFIWGGGGQFQKIFEIPLDLSKPLFES